MKKDDLKIVFLGTPDFAVESLNRIVEGGYNVVGVVTMPDKKAGRGHQLIQSPVKKYALEHNLNILQPVNLKDADFVAELQSLQADLFIVIAFRMLPEVVWQMPKLGTFNLHASLLPKYRGAAPINHAVMNGDSETGVTTFFLKHEIDTGDIIRRESISIGEDENVGSVHDRLMMLGADLTIDTIEHILAEDLKPIPQDQLLDGDQEPTPAPKIFKETCDIDWTRSAREVHNFVRGLSPYPAAWSTLVTDSSDHVEIKIFSTKVIDAEMFGEPGSIKCDHNKMYISCGEGVIEVLELRPAGKKMMSADAYLRGARFTEAKMIKTNK
jgi:methionyl-tRNA formyltransferase